MKVMFRWKNLWNDALSPVSLRVGLGKTKKSYRKGKTCWLGDVLLVKQWQSTQKNQNMSGENEGEKKGKGVGFIMAKKTKFFNSEGSPHDLIRSWPTEGCEGSGILAALALGSGHDNSNPAESGQAQMTCSFGLEPPGLEDILLPMSFHNWGFMVCRHS